MFRKPSYLATRARTALSRPGTGAFTNRNLACASLLGATFALSACGGGGGGGAHSASRAPSQPDPVSEPNAVVATVAGHAITKAAFAHAFDVEVKSEGPNAVAPVPPNFTACVKRLQAIAAESGASGEKTTTAALKNDCRLHYQKLQANALGSLIDAQWVVGGAAEEGVSVSEKELAQELKKAEVRESQAQVERQLAKSGRTLADYALQLKVQALGEAIRRTFTKRTEHVTQAQVARYYGENKALYGLPKRRDLEIAHAESEAEALKIKREIASGKTFASVIARFKLSQPVYSKKGLVLGYEPGLYSQRPLNDAIFAAKPNVLSGPVHISLGYYVFRVLRLHPPQQKTFAQVQASITHELPAILDNRELASFIKGWRKRWAARTDCQPGYVVAKCKQFKAPPSALEREGPYTF